MASTQPKPPVRITNSFVKRLGFPDKDQTIYRDSSLKGFGLRVTKGGAKTFVLEKRVAGNVRRIKIGRFPELTAEQARREAQKILGLIACGRDPLNERYQEKVKAMPLHFVYLEFLKLRQLKQSTLKDYDRAMKHAFLDWGAISMSKISEDMVLRKHAELSQLGKTTANRHMRFLRALFSFAQGRYSDGMGNTLLPNNPVLVLTRLKAWNNSRRRRTCIADGDLKSWFDAVLSLARCEEHEFAAVSMDYLQFVLLTGLRREEAAQLVWGRVDLRNRTFFVVDTKNHNDHELPLSDYLVDLLADRRRAAINEFVFPGKGPRGHIVNVYKYIAKVTEVSGVEFCLHDLRRTYATAADTLDLPERVVKRLLNHSLPTDVTSGYIISGVERLRQPMQQITNYLLSHGGLRSSVTPFASAYRTSFASGMAGLENS